VRTVLKPLPPDDAEPPERTVWPSTSEEVEAEMRPLLAYQEAFYALRRVMRKKSPPPVTFSAGEDGDEVVVEFFGADRASGGVVVLESTVRFAEDWINANKGDIRVVQIAMEIRALRRKARGEPEPPDFCFDELEES
jgi:hypothetical protein